MTSFESLYKPRKFVKYAESQPGEVLAEGVYKGTIPNKRFGGIMHIIEASIDGQQSEIVLNSSGHLNFLLGQVPAGTTIRVVYNGTKIGVSKKFAKKECHQFNVMVAKEEV
jgi:hypothetical protein